jgi:hypothetical protein
MPKEELGFFEEKKLAGFVEGPPPVTLRALRQTGGCYSMPDGVGFGEGADKDPARKTANLSVTSYSGTQGMSECERNLL